MYKQKKFRALAIMILTLILTISMCTSMVYAQAPPTVINTAPVIAGEDTLFVSINKDGTYSVYLNATDIDKDALIWSISTKPRYGTASLSDISGISGVGKATFTYRPKTGFIGKDKIVVQVKDSKRASDIITINVTVNQVNNAPVNTVAPSISGTGFAGDPLTATTGTWTDETPASLTYAYQWLVSANADGSNAVIINGAMANTYIPTDTIVGSYVSIIVTASDGTLNTEKISTSWSKVTAKPVNKAPENTAAPIISGTGFVGDPLTVTTGTWTDETSPLEYSYQWQIKDASSSVFGDITSATTNTYELPVVNTDTYFRVKVTATDFEGLFTEVFTAGILISPAPVPDTISYVSLGDSIATGTLFGTTSIPSYVTKFKEYLKSQNSNVVVDLTELATNGDRTNELYNKLGLTPNIPANTVLISAVQGADIITISIGGNNLMQAAKDGTLAGYNFNKIDTLVADRGLSDFNTHWIPIMNEIIRLNPLAQVIVTTVYNPYNESDTTMNGTSDITLHNLVDSYLFRSNTGINDLIKNNTNLDLDPEPEYSVADIYLAFDSNYKNNKGAVTYFYPDPWDWWGTFTRNPHPTALGQTILTDLHIQAYNQ